MSLLLILLTFFIDPNKIGKVNDAKSQAKEAYERGEYQKAAEQYVILKDSLGVNEDEINLNLAHSYFQLNDSTNAQNAYLSLTGSKDNELKSIANQQLGVMANRTGKFEEALDFFKNALRADPTNSDARYNYEMVKKKLEQKKKEEQNNRNKKKDPPSEYAKRLKAQADLLIAQKKYNDAYNLMSEGLKKDKTVSFYEEFIKRTQEVSTIK